MLKIRPTIRGMDNHGSGEFGAPRGDHTHRGVDFAVLPKSKVEAVTSGQVTKIGYAYSDDMQWRYVEVTDDNGFAARYFYIDPVVKYGDMIKTGDVLGSVQDIGKRYSGITPHIHFEVRDERNQITHPLDYISNVS